jgi:hypothetical protein
MSYDILDDFEYVSHGTSCIIEEAYVILMFEDEEIVFDITYRALNGTFKDNSSFTVYVSNEDHVKLLKEAGVEFEIDEYFNGIEVLAEGDLLNDIIYLYGT